MPARHSLTDGVFSVILFVNGFNRSGTTVMQEAVAAATGGTAFTVGDLIAHGSPPMAAALHAIVTSAAPVDRGVDRRPVTASLPEEYGWLLLDTPAGRRSTRFRPAVAAQLHRVVDSIAQRGDPVVMKNPHDFGLEAELLDSFPAAKMIVVRRNLPAVIDSSYRAMTRLAASRRYLLALTNNSRWVRFMLWADGHGASAAIVRFVTRWALRGEVLIRMRTVSRLPPDRVAFLDYDEMTADPHRGAHWASHLLDAPCLAREFGAAHSLPVSPKVAASWIDRRVDRYWADVWDRLRRDQLRRGVIVPTGTGATA
ncbi:MAG TPA: sulfotransferase [Acidimicrobiales bacterium]|nr:sulfotransferase [Acidimicrobiales bacterium]